MRKLIAWLAVFAATTLPAFGATYRYVDWTGADVVQGTAKGTIALPDGSSIEVSFKALRPDGSPGQLHGAQTSGGTNYWVPASTYTSAEVGNAPSTTDIIQLSGGPEQTYVLTLSQPVQNPVIAIVSLGQPGVPVIYKFSAFVAHTVLSQGPGYFGNGSLAALTGTALSGEEGNGTIQLQGSYATIGWNALTAEVWNGFTLGIRVDDASPQPGAPSAQTTAATAITATGATLNGIVGSNGSATSVTFEYGRTVGGIGGTVTAAQSPLAAGASGAAVSATLTGLVCGAEYFFAVVASNTSDTAFGNDLTFTTAACPGGGGGGGGGFTPLTGVAKVAVGVWQVCAVTNAGGLMCWGDGGLGAVGDGAGVTRITPVHVHGLGSGVAAVGVGDFHACALTVFGGVKCWGSNSDGRVGDGTTEYREVPVDVAGLTSGVAAIAVGDAHACALLASGGVKCWGSNLAGQLGDGTKVSKSSPVDVVGLASGVVAIAGGDLHTCAVTNAGEAKCWGDNNLAQLGDGTLTSRTTPGGVVGGAGFTGIATGRAHSCGVIAGGAVKCWGFNGEGQLGDGTTNHALTPVNVSGVGAPVTAIALGEDHSCALTTGGAMRCWGSNFKGALGDGTATSRSAPVTVTGLASGVSQIAAGVSISCAVAGGTLKCWGNHADGQLGDGTDPYATTPGDVVGLTSGVSKVAAGSFHGCALAAGGSAKCWGNGLNGRLGDGGTTDRSTPVNVTGLASGVSAVAGGDSHSCAVTGAGGVKCWGNNFLGQLGDGTTTSRTTPVDVSGLASGVAGVAAGSSHSCALTSAGGVLCWGRNSDGQLGDGTTTHRNTPVPVTGLGGGVAAIAAGYFHTCAVTATGGVKCWGRNDTGNLGDGTFDKRLAPVDVAGLASGVSAVTAGSGHTCARTTAGALRCWGFNNFGQLGDGTADDRANPVAVLGLGAGVSAISAGQLHTCAVVDGLLRCWGYNAVGLLGDGTQYSRRVPAAVAGLATGVTQVAAGGASTCAVTAAGGVKCWGMRERGAVGDGSPELWRATPANVVIAQPDRLAIVQLNEGAPINAGETFSVKVEARNEGSAGPVSSDTSFDLSLASGVGPFTAKAGCVIPAGGHQCTASGLRLDQPQTGAVLNAHRVAGDSLADGASATFTVFGTGTPLPGVDGNFQGLWWRSPAGSEAGWGINFAHQGDVIFATWYTYDAQGKPWWLIALLNRTAAGTFVGEVSTVAGVPFDAVPWDPSNVAETVVGTMTVTFTAPSEGTMHYTVNGVTQTKSITRQTFGPLPTCAWGTQADLTLATNYQDLWWKAPAGTEAGWGVNFSHQGDIVFATWFTYDSAGKPWWLIALLQRIAPGVYSGPVSTVTGPAWSSVPFDPAAVTETIIGAATVIFANGNSANFSYTVNGVSQTKAITRQVFVPPGTVCQ